MKQKPETMKLILEELKEQCLKVAELVDTYNNGNHKEKANTIIDLSVGVTVLNIRSGLIDKYLEEELEE